MNKLISHNGGMPFTLDDLMYIQESLKEGFKGLLHEFVKANLGNAILSGCEVTQLSNGDYSLSEGYVMLGYEIFHVPAAVTSFVISSLVVDISYDPDGNVTFFDGVQRDTYQIRKAKPYDPSTTLTSPSVTFLDENRLINLMPEKMKDNWALTDFVGKKYIFQTADFKNGATANPSYPPYAIKKNGVVRFYGSINVLASTQANTDVLELPSDIRKALSVNDGKGDVYLCSDEGSIFNIGVGTSHLVYLNAIVSGSNFGNSGVSLNSISYDVDNI